MATATLDPALLTRQLERLVLCESPSSDLAALTASAAAVAEVGEQHLGMPPELVDVDGRPHLRWRLGDPDARRLLVLGHHDTVWPLGTLDSSPWRVAGDRAYGPGCFDMKAGLVQAFAALSLCADRDGVTLLVTADEELGAPTSRALIEEEAAAAGTTLVFEASADGGAAKTARKGMSRYEVRVVGRAAHAGLEPWKGVSATVEVAHAVLAIASWGGGPDQTTVTPTLLTSGTSGNTVPGEARLVVDVRATSQAEQQRVRALLEGLRPTLAGAVVEVVTGPVHDPLEPRHSAELYALLVEEAVAAGLAPPGQASVGGASDGNIAAGVGSRVLDGLGAVGAGAHAPGEHVLLTAMAGRAELAARLVTRVLRDEARS